MFGRTTMTGIIPVMKIALLVGLQLHTLGDLMTTHYLYPVETKDCSTRMYIHKLYKNIHLMPVQSNTWKAITKQVQQEFSQC